MTGNGFGFRFRVTTFGESHGASVGGVIEGCPAGIYLNIEAINSDLCRRRGDGQPDTTQRKEADIVEWQSGVLDGVTLGTPIAFIIRNTDAHPDDYEQLKEWMRAGHADYTYEAKHGVRDYRGGGRASARETTARVVAGAIAKQLLADKGITLATTYSTTHADNPSDTVGGFVKCTIYGVKAGVGEPVFDRLNARLAYAMFTIPSVVSFEMGIGREAASMTGSEYADRWNARISTLTPSGSQLSEEPLTLTNHCGGIQGGISNGMPIEFTVAFHPVVTQIPLTQCRNQNGEVRMINISGRHDRSHVSRTSVVVESMAALVIADFMI